MQPSDHVERGPDRVAAAACVSKTIASTPALDGYHMPAEWEAHERRVHYVDSSGIRTLPCKPLIPLPLPCQDRIPVPPGPLRNNYCE